MALLKKNRIAESVISETMLIFEALFFDIFEQQEDENAVVTLLGQEKILSFGAPTSRALF